MPHCIIEHSAGINEQNLMDAVFKGALESQLFSQDDIKLRTIGYAHARAGALEQSFIHVTCKILSGRTLEQRQTLSSLIIEELRSFTSYADSVTVEVVEMERASYQKFTRQQ